MKEMKEIFVTSSFSLSMLPARREHTLKIKEASLDELRDAIRTGAFVRIGHQSTAQVLSEIVGLNIEADRTPVRLQKKDIVFVFQILQRPAEGQVFSEQEIREIVNKGKYSILRVEVIE